MKTIANVMMVLNEAEFIESAIRSVLPGVDQLIVIDQGSTDGTTDILESLRNKCPKFEWVSSRGQNYLTRGEQFFRNLCIDLCFADFLMVSDADEIMGDGWAEIAKACINSPLFEKYGALNCRYHQLIGSVDYQSVDSPLTPETGLRPLFFRMNHKLRAADPMAGTKCHTPIIGIDPPLVGTLNVDCFHMGYCKPPTERFERNITRGDWTQNESEKNEYLRRLRENPFQFLQECVPASDSLKSWMPASIRTPKRKAIYNPETRRIVGFKA